MSNTPNTLPQPIIVLKLGGSVLASEGALPLAVHEIYRWLRDGYRVVAVVSALGGVTDRLLSRARTFTPVPDERALAELLATGENTSAPLLALALDRAGVPATVLGVHRIGLSVTGPVLDANPSGLDSARVLSALRQRPVVVVPGFTGVNDAGGISLLGRGGSDLTALFIAQRLGARVRLLKDVPGLYERDPNLPGPEPRLFANLTWEDALGLDGRIVQHKAVSFARDHRLTFDVASLNGARSTVIGSAPALFADRPRKAAALRVGLLGLGTVGVGVLRGLLQLEDRFAIDTIGVKSLRKHVEAGVDPALLTTDPWRVVESPVELVIETMGGIDPAHKLVAAALQGGKHVVTANKALIARHGPALSRLARERGVTLAYSAAVGGAVPVLETLSVLAAQGPIARVQGVVNGTCNYILDRLGEGKSFESALGEAQACGFAEADPSADIDGHDAAAKAVLIAGVGFGVTIAPEDVQLEGITAITAQRVGEARARGKTIRLVATIERRGAGVLASVRPSELDDQHPIAPARDEHNRVLIEFADRREPVLLDGKGAGRYPTGEAVLGDMLALLRRREGVESSTHPGAEHAPGTLPGERR